MLLDLLCAVMWQRCSRAAMPASSALKLGPAAFCMLAPAVLLVMLDNMLLLMPAAEAMVPVNWLACGALWM